MSTEDPPAHAPASGHHATAGAGLTLAALGIVYGDIGTSPLYAFRESLEGAGHELAVTPANVLGLLSLVFWSLVVIITVKYLALVMRADNGGEGGILALTSLITPPEGSHKPARWSLILIGLFGTSLLYGDGMITPAISVLAAVEGIAIAAPAVEHWIVPIAVAILIALFAIQRRGTASVGTLFGPIMLLWFAVLAALGLPHIIAEPAVLAAVNPAHAVRFFADGGFHSFLALGSVFLVVTGGEALYADMGHFGRKPIQIGWYAVVLPGLLLNYFGQGALLLRDPAAGHPFYSLAPGWAVLPLVVLATMATVIASQALISGVYSLTMQAVQLGYAPRVRIEHTSAQAFGQIYIPAVNWALLLACIGLVVGFRSSSALAAAYGVAVTATMVITTLLFFVVLRERFHWSTPAAAGFCGAMLLIEGGFFAANLFKIPHGGWFPLVIGAIVFTVLTTWSRGRKLVRERIRRDELRLEDYIDGLFSRPDAPLRVPGTAIYLFGDPGGAPPALIANLRHHEALHERVIVLTVVVDHVPRVLPIQRGRVIDCGHGVTGVELHYGFLESPDVPRGLREGTARHLGIDPYRAVYFLGSETIRSTTRPGMARWRERLYVLISRNANSAADYFNLPPEHTISVGVQVEI